MWLRGFPAENCCGAPHRVVPRNGKMMADGTGSVSRRVGCGDEEVGKLRELAGHMPNLCGASYLEMLMSDFGYFLGGKRVLFQSNRVSGRVLISSRSTLHKILKQIRAERKSS